MTTSELFGDAEAAIREYAVYLSHDEDGARKRGQPERAAVIRQRCNAAHELADELHSTDPATVAGSRAELATVRAIAAELVHRLGDLQPEIRTARRAVVNPSPTPGTLRPVAPARVVAYLRVSTDRQADEGFGLKVQEAAIREWARRHRMRVAYVVRDEGTSGAADVIDRPGLAEALGHVAAGRARAVVVARIDRLARDLVLQEWIRAELLRAGGELRSADRVEDLYLVDDPDNPTGTLVRQILGAVAQYERAMIRLRMAAGKAKKREAGGYTGGRPPYGYRAAGGTLVADVDEQREIARMKRWRREGRSYRWIADRLNAEGIPCRAGRWHPPTVARATERPARRSA